MYDARDPLRTLFGSLADRRFFILQPGGNWGDCLIYLGGENLASEMGVTWQRAKFEQLDQYGIGSGDVIYIQGGGGFTDKASGRALRCLAAALSVPGAEVIQGPCTVDNAEVANEVSRLCGEFKAKSLRFVAREERTVELVAPQLPGNVQFLINEDTAFYVTAHELQKKAKSRHRKINLYGIREDTEAVRIPISSKDGLERPTLGVVLDPAQFARSFDHWIRIHIAARRIVTNRTHSAICGALLGTPTAMFAGAYHKNRSVWEFSLAQRNVGWLEIDDVPSVMCKADALLQWVPTCIRTSWKVNRCAYRLCGVPRI